MGPRAPTPHGRGGASLAAGRVARWEEFQEAWGALVEASRSPKTFVVVEGERDRRSVRRLGLAGEVVLLHRGQPVRLVAHDLARRARRVILLTDWDAQGGRLAHLLAEFLKAMPLELDLEHRRQLARLLRGELTHVEGLYGWARRTAEALGEPLEPWLDRLEAETSAR